MKEKLLAALKTKFQGVQDAVLDRIATKKAETVTEESQVQTVVDGLTTNDLINSEADFRASQASQSSEQKALQKAVAEYEKKHNLKDGKPIEKTDPGKDTLPDDAPEWAKKMIGGLTSKVEEQSKQIDSLSKGQAINSKLTEARDLLGKSKIPEKYREKWIKRIDTEDQETSLEDQVKSLEDEYLELEQEIVKTKVTGGHERGVAGTEASDEEMDDYLKDKYGESAEKKD